MFSFFKSKIQIKEDVFFRNLYYVYVAKYYDNGDVEMWCHAMGLPALNMKSEYFLGNFYDDGRWERPKTSYQLPYAMNKGAERLFKEMVAKIEPRKPEKPENKVWTREDFVNFGKKGQHAVKEKYGKPPVNMRWKK